MTTSLVPKLRFGNQLLNWQSANNVAGRSHHVAFPHRAA